MKRKLKPGDLVYMRDKDLETFGIGLSSYKPYRVFRFREGPRYECWGGRSHGHSGVVAFRGFDQHYCADAFVRLPRKRCKHITRPRCACQAETIKAFEERMARQGKTPRTNTPAQPERPPVPTRVAWSPAAARETSGLPLTERGVMVDALENARSATQLALERSLQQSVDEYRRFLNPNPSSPTSTASAAAAQGPATAQPSTQGAQPAAVRRLAFPNWIPLDPLE